MCWTVASSSWSAITFGFYNLTTARFDLEILQVNEGWSWRRAYLKSEKKIRAIDGGAYADQQAFFMAL